MLNDYNMAKSFEFDSIDSVQYFWAIKDISFRKLQMEPFHSIYNTFVRPLERLFASEMPLNDKLISALHSKDTTTNLATFIRKLIGWEQWPNHLTDRKVVEELSRIRAVPLSHFTKTNPQDPLIMMLNRTECAAMRKNMYKDYSVREELCRKGFNIQKIFKSQTKEELDETSEQLAESLIESCKKIESMIELIKKSKMKRSCTLDPDVGMNLFREEESIKRQLSEKKTIHIKMWRDFRADIEKRGLQRYELGELSRTKQIYFEDMKAEELIKTYKDCKEHHKMKLEELRDKKQTWNEILGAKEDSYTEEIIRNKLKVFNRVKAAKIDIKKILEDMQFMHAVVQDQMVPIYEYEDDSFRRARMKRQPTPNDSGTYCPPPRKRSSPEHTSY